MKQEIQTKIDTVFYIADQIVSRIVSYSLSGLIIYAVAKAVGVI